jgi:chemotaxis protein CheX
MKITSEHVMPFVRSAQTTFKNMLRSNLSVGKLFIQEPGVERTAMISGVIGLSGGVKGAIILAFEMDSIFPVLSAFVGDQVTKFDSDACDALGELCNIIAGYAKKDLPDLKITISLPTVVSGKNHIVHLPSGVPIMCIPVKTDLGDFFMEVCMKLVDEK